MLSPSDLLRSILAYIPRVGEEWEARECILAMRDAGYRNWRQTEWVGFYLEFLTENTSLPGVAHLRLFVGNTSFNGCAGKNVVDYKTSSYGSSGIILNDKEAMDRVVAKYGELGYVIVRGVVEKETDEVLDAWRKGIVGKSKYVIAGEKSGRYHRKLKVKFNPDRLLYIPITKRNIGLLQVFRQGRNSDGRPRRVKYILPASLINQFVVAEVGLGGMRRVEQQSV